MIKDKIRCEWVGSDPQMVEYHDLVWGKPVHDDRLLFEFLNLEGAQAGLSWSTVLKKIKNYEKAFDNFEAGTIVLYDDKKIVSLLENQGIIRNRLKIVSTIHNAKEFMRVVSEFGSFDKYLWQFVGGKTLKHSFKSVKEYPVKTKEAQQMSKDLLKRGFKFVGPTICYAFMQAVGMVNDHQVKCFRYTKV